MKNHEIIQEGFSNTVGAVLAMLVENDASRTLKTAVRAEIYRLCDDTVQPMVAKLETKTETSDKEMEAIDGNR